MRFANPDPPPLPAHIPDPEPAQPPEETVRQSPEPHAAVAGASEAIAACIRRVQAGDREAFEPLARAYQATALRVARALVGDPADAEDAVQEALLRLFRSIHRLDPQRDPLGWIYRLTVHACWDLLGRRGKQSRVVEELRNQDPPATWGPVGGPAVEIDAGRKREALRAALQVLPPRVRAAFVLHEVEELPVIEVARALRVTRITVRRHLMIGRRRLRAHLQMHNPELLRM
jgi:RNA polymerase sigma-70 factor (ECF subfamily)